MFESFLKKNFWQSLFTGPTGGRTKFTFEELRALSDVLSKNEVVTEANRAVVVETIRSIAEFMIWGDQNEPRIFDYFLENNILHYLHRILQQPTNRTGDVAKQVLQTLSIIIQNIRSETGTYFLFSNNHINNIVEIRFDFEDEEVLGYYISFLKTISLKLNARTVQFFFDRRETACTFPLYSEAVKFAHHKEGMVRAGVRTLTLNVYSVPDENIQDFICRPPATSYFAEMVTYIADQIKILDKRMSAAEGFSAQVLSSLDSQLAEVEDMVSYVADILSTAHPKLAHLVAEQLWVSLVGPYLLRPLLEYGSSSNKTATRTGAGARRPSGAGGTPGSPGVAAGSAPVVRAACSLYCLERLFVLITYPPLLHNLALALLDPRAGHPSCRPALVSVLRSEDHRAVPAVLRCLVGLVHNRRIATELLALLGLVPRSRSADPRIVVCSASASDCDTCLLDQQLPPLPAGCPPAGAPPDPLAEEAQPVATAVSGAAAGGSASAFAYYVLWTQLERAAEWVFAQRGFGEQPSHGRNGGSGVVSSYGESGAAGHQEPGDSGLETETEGQEVPAGESAQDLLGNHLDAPYASDMASDEASVRAASFGQGGVALLGEPRDLAQPLLDDVVSGSAAVGGGGAATQASAMDLLGLGSLEVGPSQPASRQPTGREADLLGLNGMALPTAPAPSSPTAGAQADVAASAPLPPEAAEAGVTGARSAWAEAAGPGPGAGALADLLDLGTEDLAAPVGPLSSAALAPSGSLATAPGPAVGLAPDSLLDNLLLVEPSYSGPTQDQGPSTAPPGNRAVAAHGAAGPREASSASPVVAAPVAGPLGATSSAGFGIQPTTGPLISVFGELAAAPAARNASAGAPLLDLADTLGALDVGSLLIAPGLQGAASSSSAGSAAAGGSFNRATTGVPADASASETLSYVLESSSSEPGQQGTTGVGIKPVPGAPSPQASAEAAAPLPPPAAPLPPAPAPAPPAAFTTCAAHARPAALLCSTDLLDALFALLSMQLLPVQGLWHVGHLLHQLYPRVAEQRELDRQLQLLRQQQQGAAASDEPADRSVANPLGLDPGTAAAAAAGSSAAASPVASGQDTLSSSKQQQQQQLGPRPQAASPAHPLDPASTAGWACELSGGQREALRVAAVSAASAVLDEVGGMWCDGLVAMLVLEWPLAVDAVSRPVLRTGAEQLTAGPHLYPRQNARGLSGAGRNDQGLSGSAVAALHSYHAVARLVALLLVHDLLCRGAVERSPPATVPPLAGADVEGREWDVLEGQEVELQAGSAIPCIVSFSPGQERRVYFAAAGPALRRVGEYLHSPQVLLSDPGSQSVVLHSSPAVVLADPAPTRLNAGVVLSVSPLLGCDPAVDKSVAKWLHVHVRPSVRGLLRLLRSAAGGRKGGLLGALRHLVDGHWVLAFPDPERAANARQLVEQAAHRLRALYCELLSPVLGTVME